MNWIGAGEQGKMTEKMEGCQDGWRWDRLEVMIAMLIYLYYCKIWFLRIDKCGKMLLNDRLPLWE